MSSLSRAEIFKGLQADVLRLQGLKSVGIPSLDLGLGLMKNAFPNSTFPLGSVHEFLSAQTEDTASTSGFIAGLLSNLKGTVAWISSSRTLFPPALKSFGLEPDRFIFLDLQKEKDVVWAMEEALKCAALSAVVAEIREIDFTASRRLQLAVEQSRVTGFIIRKNYKKLNTTACVSRWKITSMSGDLDDDLPGVGYPKWKVELLRIRNGKPGAWEIQWKDGRFMPVYNFTSSIEEQKRKAG
jgi:protein ImuA